MLSCMKNLPCKWITNLGEQEQITLVWISAAVSEREVEYLHRFPRFTLSDLCESLGNITKDSPTNQIYPSKSDRGLDNARR